MLTIKGEESGVTVGEHTSTLILNSYVDPLRDNIWISGLSGLMVASMISKKI